MLLLYYPFQEVPQMLIHSLYIKSSMHPGGYSLRFYMGFCVNIGGLRFYKKIVFGICELKLKEI